MSRRPSASASRPSASSATPYPRRATGQPKSSRQQFSACGACRMRRVRCDLKDSYNATSASSIQLPSCSNCRERNIKCVDEFAEVKAVKLLRRGRRLQQVEAVYGKVSGDISATPGVQEPMSAMFSAVTATAKHGLIPQMQPTFLKSSFFRRFCVQRPILEPSEFASRYLAHVEGAALLSIEGEMLAMLLVTWAAAFGIDEFGSEDAENDTSENRGSPHFIHEGGEDHTDSKRSASILRVDAMVRELLTLVDQHGLLRRPSWDGVRVLLLLLPLTHGIQSPIERTTTYEATLSQVYALCNIDNPPSIDSGLGPYCDILIRARTFWCAYIHEGVTTALDGGRILLSDDDLVSFEHSLPPQYCAMATSSVSPSADSSRSSPVSGSPVISNFPFNIPLEPNHPRAALAYVVASQHFSLVLDVSKVCRSIHSTLTGPRARRMTEPICKEAVVEIWDNLERCWDNFETLRHNPSGVGAAGGDLIRGEDVERFVSGWQVFIFQSLNVVREALPHPTENNSSADQAFMATLHLSAIRRCQKFLPRVITMLQRHLKVPSNFFAYDTGLIHDGCFFAGLLLAQSDKLDGGRDTAGWDADWEEGVMACVQALGETRFVYCRTQERVKTLRAEWEARIERDTSRRLVQRSPLSFPLKESPGHSPCLNDNTPLPCSNPLTSRPRNLSLVSAGGQVRPLLPPLSVSFPQDDSGPDTVLTDDGSGSWEAYTPPPTSESMIGMVVAHRSLSPSSSPHNPAMVMVSTHDATKDNGPIFGDEDNDQFSYTVEGTPGPRTSESALTRTRWTPFSYLDSHVLGCDSGFSSRVTPHQSYYS